MKTQIQFQRMQLQLALGWLRTIDVCDTYIEKGNDVDFYKEKRSRAVLGYTQAMTEIVQSIIEFDKYKQENLVTDKTAA